MPPRVCPLCCRGARPHADAGPRGGDVWNARLREELTALITAVTANRAADRDWFTLTCDDTVREGATRDPPAMCAAASCAAVVDPPPPPLPRQPTPPFALAG